VRIKRQKQKPFFSTLEEIELEILAREAKKEDHPSERVPTKPEGDLTKPESVLVEPERVLPEPGGAPTETIVEPIVIQPPAAADAVTEPPSDLFRINEIRILEKEKTKESFPSEEVLIKPVVEPNVVQPSAPVVEDSFPRLSRKIGVRIADAPFVYISPGTFIMGSPEHEPGRGRDEMQHEVTLTRGYFIQTTPVTQGQWKEVMGDNPSNFLQGGEDCPVEGVSLNDCLEFIWRVNNKGNYPYRLPTEAEWEYACRAGTSTSFFNGEITIELSSLIDPCLDAIGWYSGNSSN